MARKRNNKRSNQAASLTPLEELAQTFANEQRPEGWYTTAELAEMFGVAQTTVKRYCEARGYECRLYKVHNNIPKQKCYKMT